MPRRPRKPDVLDLAVSAGLNHPADRPWYVLPAPDPMPARWRARCPIHPRSHPPLSLTVYRTADGYLVALGQCPTCQAVAWAVRKDPTDP